MSLSGDMRGPQGAAAVGAFNARFGEMEQVLWCLSRHSRTALLDRQSSPVVEALVWTVRSWWPVQGVSRATGKVISTGLTSAVAWSPRLFEPVSGYEHGAEDFAIECVTALVSRCQLLGAPRREYSLAAKVLHLLMPWRVPAFDKNVRERVGVPDWDNARAYIETTRRVFALARELDQHDDISWMGTTEPLSPLPRSTSSCGQRAALGWTALQWSGIRGAWSASSVFTAKTVVCGLG